MRTEEANKIFKILNISHELTELAEWREWSEVIPYLQLDPRLELKVVPPFSGALIRFLVRNKETKEVVSIYLDGYNLLGYYEKPYWEMYPYENDVFRCGIQEIDLLVENIEEVLLPSEKDDPPRTIIVYGSTLESARRQLEELRKEEERLIGLDYKGNSRLEFYNILGDHFIAIANSNGLRGRRWDEIFIDTNLPIKSFLHDVQPTFSGRGTMLDQVRYFD